MHMSRVAAALSSDGARCVVTCLPVISQLRYRAIAVLCIGTCPIGSTHVQSVGPSSASLSCGEWWQDEVRGHERGVCGR